MITIRITGTDKAEYEVQAKPGMTLMEAAKAKSIPGVDADCGGNAACGTCAMSFGQGWEHLLEGRGADEDDMLEFSVETPSKCRLSCQIELSDQMDGLTAVVETER
ncbi:2Fe-2S iron-sulfur cluster-binding protein [Roseobacter sp. HKCCA2468]|uniref:2Fe-2S iron-sulfur cluster-binding protein n=1 Tax=Roseobacter sp. HKCCA2468 TaxID=3120342 RepID=UPI0030ED2E26